MNSHGVLLISKRDRVCADVPSQECLTIPHWLLDSGAVMTDTVDLTETVAGHYTVSSIPAIVRVPQREK